MSKVKKIVAGVVVIALVGTAAGGGLILFIELLHAI